MELIVFCSRYYYVTIVVGTTLRELFFPSSQCFCILARNGYSLLISPDEVSLDHDTERKKNPTQPGFKPGSPGAK